MGKDKEKGTPAGPDRRALKIKVSGRVQGVGYRYSAVHAARRFGVSGWVRNERDGSVLILAEGTESALRAFAGWCRKGPPGGRVDTMETYEVPYRNLPRKFEVDF